MSLDHPPGIGSDGDSFDYIIVGAGSAGCVLANRLSADPGCRVLLIEAGPPDRHPLIPVPMGVGALLAQPRLTWRYVTEPDPGSGNRPSVWQRGKMLGGSSSLNGMIYCRGQPEDYDGWEALGAPGWGWSEMARCFRAMEDHALGDDGLRGAGGPLHVSIQPHRSPLTDAILAAAAALGTPRKDDVNRPQQEGIGHTPCTLKDGRRVSAADAFLKPVRRRPNLRVLTGVTVQRVLFDGCRAVGVAALRERAALTLRARREVILCAGALESPKLLQLSGVGPAELLGRLGIPVISDLAGVGGNLREHKVISLQHRLALPYSFNPELRGWRMLRSALRYLLGRKGPLAATYDINGFIKTRPGLLQPDAQITFWALSLQRDAEGLALEPHPGLMAMGYPLRTESEGSLAIESADPEAAPRIHTRFLHAEHDRSVIIGLFRYLRRLYAQPGLQPFLAAETWPGPQAQTDEEILEACRRDGTCFHAVGTCSMGSGPRAVVDARLRVRGVENLRVMDCSVMPTQVSGNTNGPVMAMAWRAAELILDPGR